MGFDHLCKLKFQEGRVSLLMCLLCMLTETMKKSFTRQAFALILAFSAAGCTTNRDDAHTTATTYVPAPPHQVLTVVPAPATSTTNKNAGLSTTPANPKEPYFVVNLVDERKFRVGDPVPIDFTINNAKLKDKGGEFRVRYIIDDGEMKWIDQSDPVWLAGWVPGEHTIRVELVGPDGWPVKNGDANIVTKKILVTE